MGEHVSSRAVRSGLPAIRRAAATAPAGRRIPPEVAPPSGRTASARCSGPSGVANGVAPVTKYMFRRRGPQTSCCVPSNRRCPDHPLPGPASRRRRSPSSSGRQAPILARLQKWTPRFQWDPKPLYTASAKHVICRRFESGDTIEPVTARPPAGACGLTPGALRRRSLP